MGRRPAGLVGLLISSDRASRFSAPMNEATETLYDYAELKYFLTEGGEPYAYPGMYEEILSRSASEAADLALYKAGRRYGRRLRPPVNPRRDRTPRRPRARSRRRHRRPSARSPDASRPR